MARAPRKPKALKVTTPERPVFDTRSGTVNIWPIVVAESGALAAEIAAGDHDDYLSFLKHIDKSQNDGGRPLVQEAIAKRKG